MITEDKTIAVRAAITELIEFMDDAAAEYFSKAYPNLKPSVHSAEFGRKYVRIVQGADQHGRNVHCFVDARTGGVYKAAGWKAPALNGERFNILDPESLSLLKASWDPHGGYLYKK